MAILRNSLSSTPSKTKLALFLNFQCFCSTDIRSPSSFWSVAIVLCSNAVSFSPCFIVYMLKLMHEHTLFFTPRSLSRLLALSLACPIQRPKEKEIEIAREREEREETKDNETMLNEITGKQVVGGGSWELRMKRHQQNTSWKVF